LTHNFFRYHITKISKAS